MMQELPEPPKKNTGVSLLKTVGIPLVTFLVGIGIGVAVAPKDEGTSAAVPSASATQPPTQTPSPTLSPTPSPTPEPEAVSYRLERSRIHPTLKVTERQCFGSAGCLITVELRLAIDDASSLPRDGTWDVTYAISGDESGSIIGTFQLFGNGKYEVNEELISTASENIQPRVRVVSVERV
jgi:hypothetical protein